MTRSPNILARVARLERDGGVGRACPRCGAGGPADQIRFTLHATPYEPTQLQPCPACGRVPISFTLNIGPALRQQEHHP